MFFVCLCRRMCCKECCGIWAGEWCLIKPLLVSVWGASQHPEGFGPLELSHREPLFIHTDLGKTQRGCCRINKQVPFKKIGITINVPLVRAESPSMAFLKIKGQFKLKKRQFCQFLFTLVSNMTKRYIWGTAFHAITMNGEYLKLSKLLKSINTFYSPYALKTIFRVFWSHR